MESLSRISYRQQPPCLLSLHHHRPSFARPPISSIKISRPFPSPLSLKIKASSSDSLPICSNPKSVLHPKTLNPISLFSLLKTPLCVAVAATALFFSTFGHKPLPAIAQPVSAPMVETSTEEQTASEEEREKSLEAYLASHPDDVEALKSLMEVKIKSRKLPEAVEVINRLIELEPNNDFEWLLLRAHMYTYMGETELAKAGFEDILAKDPLRVEAFHGLVMAVSQGEGDSDGKELDKVMKRVQEAMERCRREKRKDDVRDFNLLIAQIRVIEGNYTEALKVYQELVKEEPRDFRPYLCQGIIYTLLRKKDEAEKQFDKYKRLVPKGHPYAQYFDDNMLATKVFSQMAENESMKAGSRS